MGALNPRNITFQPLSSSRPRNDGGKSEDRHVSLFFKFIVHVIHVFMKVNGNENYEFGANSGKHEIFENFNVYSIT